VEHNLINVYHPVVQRYTTTNMPADGKSSFFVHLVKSLGAKDFLPAVAMLLVDRATTKAGRSSGAAQAIEMALGVAGAFEVSVRLETMRQVVQEIARLFDDLSTDEKRAFLSQMWVMIASRLCSFVEMEEAGRC
jgi:hypothetical protein